MPLPALRRSALPARAQWNTLTPAKDEFRRVSFTATYAPLLWDGWLGEHRLFAADRRGRFQLVEVRVRLNEAYQEKAKFEHLIAQEAIRMHKAAFSDDPVLAHMLDAGGEYAWRVRGVVRPYVEGQTVKVKGDELLVMREEDIMGVIEGA